MKIRITRPEKSDKTENPGDLGQRSGYFAEIQELQEGTVFSRFETGEVIDVQSWPDGRYIGRYRKNGEGRVIKLVPATHKLLACPYGEEHGYFGSFAVDPTDTPQQIANEAYQAYQFAPDRLWLFWNDPTEPECPVIKAEYVCDKDFNFQNHELSTGGCLEFPEADSGRIRYRDIHGNCEDYRDPDDDDYDEWAKLFQWTYFG